MTCHRFFVACFLLIAILKFAARDSVCAQTTTPYIAPSIDIEIREKVNNVDTNRIVRVEIPVNNPINPQGDWDNQGGVFTAYYATPSTMPPPALQG